MALYPEVQKRAQADIDHAVHDRLPTLDDLDALPYLRALIKEISRWGPVAPLGLPHRVLQDDVYEGYFIPKGATVVGNVWYGSFLPAFFHE
jgi:cytochrome P450